LIVIAIVYAFVFRTPLVFQSLFCTFPSSPPLLVSFVPSCQLPPPLPHVFYLCGLCLLFFYVPRFSVFFLPCFLWRNPSCNRCLSELLFVFVMSFCGLFPSVSPQAAYPCGTVVYSFWISLPPRAITVFLNSPASAGSCPFVHSSSPLKILLPRLEHSIESFFYRFFLVPPVPPFSSSRSPNFLLRPPGWLPRCYIWPRAFFPVDINLLVPISFPWVFPPCPSP